MNREIIKVLIVEDDEDDFIITRDLLAEIKGIIYETDRVSTYDAALKAIGLGEHHVYLIDYRLGEHTGLELMREAIKKGCMVPMILLTGQGDLEIDLQAMKSGAMDYLVKGQTNTSLLERSIRYAIERKQLETQLFYNAFHDVLTGLPNRALFMDRLNRVFELRKRHEEYLYALLYLDLDRFKIINDSLGHLKGDELLVAVSKRFLSCVRASDTIARPGGDEFIIILDNIKNLDDPIIVAERLLHKLTLPFYLGKQEIFISTSIGIALGNIDYESLEHLMSSADTAMYRAKALGKARYEIYKFAQHEHQPLSTLRLESDMRRAIERKQFLLYYQPIVSLKSNGITGVEALLRWQHPKYGLRLPADFMPLAEETGLIVSIGEWVLRTACAQGRAWHDAGYSHLNIKINFSVRQFENENMVETIRNVIQETGISAQTLEIEITETIAMKDINYSANIMKKLSSMGIHIALDDFGIGYSSLGLLKSFPINTLKIDRSFISDSDKNPDAALITKAIVGLAQNLKMNTIAEGVETEEQLSFLRRINCDEIQGYLISRPVPDEVMTRLLREGLSLPLPNNGK